MSNHNSALLTDFYELTMAQGCFLNQHNPQVVFEMFFRRSPFGSGFAVFAGLEDLLTRLCDWRFSEADIAYLKAQDTFRPEFLDYLKDYRFSGSLFAMDEGSLIFPGEPVIRIHSGIIDSQIIESLLLNTVNFQSLIATKAARLFVSSGSGKILEFGLRRAQGVDGAITASRAAYIGGAFATSNTLASRKFGIPVSGTMAHSWVMSFDNELDAFRRFAEIYPDKTILLIDTYNTLGSGIENAIIVGQELKSRGKNFGVRLDSGDLHYLSTKVRKRLDDADLQDAFIVASNDLNEEIIWQLISSGAPINYWGVGTQLVTGGSDSSLTGVYKMVARQIDGEYRPTIKISDHPEKITNPGIKQVYRFYDKKNSPVADLLCQIDEKLPESGTINFNHPMYRYKKFSLSHNFQAEAMLKQRVSKGEICYPHPPLAEIRSRVISQIDRLDSTYTRLINPHIYKVSLSDSLKDLKFAMIDERLGN